MATKEANTFNEEVEGSEGETQLSTPRGFEQERGLEETKDEVAQEIKKEPECAEVRPFETRDCVDCQRQVDDEEAMWYRQEPYCQ